MRQLDDAALDARVKGLDYPVGILLDGVVEHGTYHGGQIALLRKAKHENRLLQDRGGVPPLARRASRERDASCSSAFTGKARAKPSISYKEAVDEALCFGWIDGIKKRVDEERYTHRFTPRKQDSIWSLVNATRVKELIALKRMAKPGLEAWERRDPKKTGIYSFENRPKTFDRGAGARVQKEHRRRGRFSARSRRDIGA